MTTPRELLDDLRRAGFDVDDVWVLVNRREPYRAAIPVLLDWLEHAAERGVPAPDLPKLEEGIVRALAVREARPAAAPLLVALMRPACARGDQALAWAIGNTLGVVADDSSYEAVVSLAEDRSIGIARQMLVMDALSRMTDPKATDVLLGLLDDGDVAGHAIAGLAKRRDERARAAFERFAHDQRPWVRREAQKGLARLAT